MTDKRLTNNLRAELYKLLFPRIIEEDYAAGVEANMNFWDDPLLKWDEGALWDDLGIVPVIKNLFFAIEQEETRDLEFLDQLTDLIDPNKCPAFFLDIMARSLGHPLEENLSEVKQREVIKSVMQMHQARGREISWSVFYRMMGWQVEAIPLWKKKIFEDNEDYHTERYVVSHVDNELLGVAGLQQYAGTLNYTPIKPNSLRIAVGSLVLRDDGNTMSDTFGHLLAVDQSFGTINYATGEYVLHLESVAGTDVYAQYDRITDEYPYHAARVDLEFYIFLDDETVSHTFDQDILNKLLERAEEVRPIHVLLRLVLVVLDAADVVDDCASDGIQCGPRLGKDVRLDQYRFYAADVGLGGGDADFDIEKDFTVDLERIKLLNEEIPLCPVADKLEIEFDNGVPTQYW